MWVTEHANRRMQQRGIAAMEVSIVRSIGSVDGLGDVRRYRVDRRALAAAGARGVSPALLATAAGVVVVARDDGLVITTWRDAGGSPRSTRVHERRRERHHVREFLRGCVRDVEVWEEY